jgi:hypothetical protein
MKAYSILSKLAREHPVPVVLLRQVSRFGLLLLSIGTSLSAVACPAGQAEVCVVSCICVPGNQADVDAVYANVQHMAAAGLEAWLVQSHSTAAAGATEAIPLNIRAQLEPYYDLQVLDSARYKVGDDVEFNAAHTMLQNPDVNAVTLVDIIVFRNQDDAQSNVALWAHELKHVQQYQQWGVREFAARYTRDYKAVEAPAYQMQSQVSRALKASAKPAASALETKP